MKEHRKDKVNQEALDALNEVLQRHVLDTHEALMLLSVAAHSLMVMSQVKSFEIEEHGDGLRLSRFIFDDNDEVLTTHSDVYSGKQLH